MAAFNIQMSSPIRSGFTHGLGGPGSGGHQGPNWYISAGMDLGAAAGTEVFAAFDAHITRFNPHVRAQDSAKVYGAQLFMRSANNMMGGFYTHLTGVPASIRVGANVSRGDTLGTIFTHGGMAAHLHFALVEIIGGAPGGRYVGVNLYRDFQGIANTTTVKTVTFQQDGSAPAMT